MSSASFSKRQSARLQAAESARLNRDKQQQDIGFSSRPFAWCNIPIRPMRDQSVYERRNGKFFLRIEAGQGKELPYGQDRLVLILLATMAVQQKTRVIKLGTASEILRLFGRSESGTHYRRLMESFDRIFSATIYWGREGETNKRRFIEQYRLSVLDHLKLWYESDLQVSGAPFQNEVILSERFYEELVRHPLPVDMEVVRALLDCPGELDFYIWIVLRAWATPDHAPIVQIPLFGPYGLKNQLGTQVKENFKFRQMVRGWLKRTAAYWADCPAHLDEDGNTLLIEQAQAIHSVQKPEESASFPRTLR